MTTLLLFDLDGTLLLTGGAGLRAMKRTGIQLFGPGFSFDGVVVAGGLDPQIFAEAARASGISDPHIHQDTFRSLYLEVLAEELAPHSSTPHSRKAPHPSEAQPTKAYPLPGIPALLDHLAQRDDLTVGLVTGNYRQAAPLKLQAAGIDPGRFEVTAFGDDAPDRTALVALAIDRHRQAAPPHQQSAPTPRQQPTTGASARPPGPVIVIGDTPRDIASAHANAAYCVAVATGLYNEQQLRDAGADLTLATFDNPDPFFQFLSDCTTHSKRPERTEQQK